MAAASLFSEATFEETVDFETADGQPEIALLAWRIEKLDSTRYSTELYWLSRRSISTEYSVRLRLYAADSMRPEFSNKAAATAVHMGPLNSISPWQQGKVTVVGQEFEFYTDPSAITVGVFDAGSQPLQFLSLSGQESNFFELDISTLISD